MNEPIQIDKPELCVVCGKPLNTPADIQQAVHFECARRELHTRYDLPICENCCNVLTIHDQIATDGQSLLCRHCESGCDWCEHFLEMNQICGHCGREK